MILSGEDSSYTYEQLYGKDTREGVSDVFIYTRLGPLLGVQDFEVKYFGGFQMNILGYVDFVDTVFFGVITKRG